MSNARTKQQAPSSWTRSSLAAWLGGTLRGPDGPVERVADPSDASQNDVVAARNPKFLGSCLASQAGLVMTLDSQVDDAQWALEAPRALLLVTDIESAWEGLLEAFYPQLELPMGVDPSAQVHETALIGQNVHVGPSAVIARGARVGAGSQIMAGAYVGQDSELGQDCKIYPNVTLLHHVRLQDRVIVQSGAVIGSDGFGYRRTNDHRHLRLPHIGGVLLEHDVEIGPNSVVDRGTVGDTVIGARSKVGATCIVAHNCQVGQDVLLIGAVQIGGSTVIEDRAVLWGQVGVAGHLTIGAGSTVTAQSGVSKTLTPDGVFRGSPARPVKEFARTEARVRDLEHLIARVAELEHKMTDLSLATQDNLGFEAPKTES